MYISDDDIDLSDTMYQDDDAVGREEADCATCPELRWLHTSSNSPSAQLLWSSSDSTVHIQQYPSDVITILI